MPKRLKSTTAKYIVCATMYSAILGFCGIASADELVAEFKSRGNVTTTEFEVEAPWILDWRINSDYSHMLSFDLDLVDGATGVLKGNVLRRKSLGNGVRLFNESGKFRFRINGSFIDWHLKVKELTKAEAEQYTPRTPR